MNSSFVNRLVGTSIVVVAAIVFIPNILDGEKVHHKESFPTIPERPEFTTIDLQAEVNAKVDVAERPSEDVIENEQALDEDNASYQAALADESSSVDTNGPSSAEPKHDNVELAEQPIVKTEVAKVEKPVVEVTAVAKKRNPNLDKTAYVIQLGSFSHKANVDALVEKLKKAGFDTFTRPVKTPNGTLTKVFVGPTTNKASLEGKLLELKKLTKLNGRLTEFEPTK